VQQENPRSAAGTKTRDQRPVIAGRELRPHHGRDRLTRHKLLRGEKTPLQTVTHIPDLRRHRRTLAQAVFATSGRELRRSVGACGLVFEGEDMVAALRPIEVRTAAADEVPKVAAALADAFINDPVFTFLALSSVGAGRPVRSIP
jgi:hypothetical protein